MVDKNSNSLLKEKIRVFWLISLELNVFTPKFKVRISNYASFCRLYHVNIIGNFSVL